MTKVTAPICAPFITNKLFALTSAYAICY